MMGQESQALKLGFMWRLGGNNLTGKGHFNDWKLTTGTVSYDMNGLMIHIYTSASFNMAHKGQFTSA